VAFAAFVIESCWRAFAVTHAARAPGRAAGEIFSLTARLSLWYRKNVDNRLSEYRTSRTAARAKEPATQRGIMPVDELRQLTAASRHRLVDEVSHAIEEAILAGHMRPGERLVEAAIAERLGVSRTTVREALLMLERQGLIVSRPRRGTFVTRLSREDALDMGFTRALLEGFAVSAGFERIDDGVIRHMEQLLAAMGACRLPADIPRLMQIDVDFHRPLVEAARSPRLLELWSGLNGQIRALYLTTLESQQVRIEEIVAFHQLLIDAVRSGDPALAQRTVFQHYVRLPEGEAPPPSLTQILATMAPAYRGLLRDGVVGADGIPSEA
jgi:DNA-binding GntR family transcriptional regulator